MSKVSLPATLQNQILQATSTDGDHIATKKIAPAMYPTKHTFMPTICASPATLWSLAANVSLVPAPRSGFAICSKGESHCFHAIWQPHECNRPRYRSPFRYEISH